MFVSRALLGFSVIWLLRLYLVHFYDSFSVDYYVCISRTFKFLSSLINMFVSRALLGFFSFDYYVCVLRTFRILSFDYHVCISRTFRILSQLMIIFVSRALLWFFFSWLLRLYLAHFLAFPSFDYCVCISRFKDSLLFDYYVYISRTFRIVCHLIITFVSCALLGLSVIRLLHLYLVHL